jgi:hypothetical protein
MKTILFIVALIFFGCMIYFDVSSGVHYGRYEHSPLGYLFMIMGIISFLFIALINLINKNSGGKKS